jgi:hypothetical protein
MNPAHVEAGKNIKNAVVNKVFLIVAEGSRRKTRP